LLHFHGDADLLCFHRGSDLLRFHWSSHLLHLLHFQGNSDSLRFHKDSGLLQVFYLFCKKPSLQMLCLLCCRFYKNKIIFDNYLCR
jgi:hypothetical protein